MISRFTTFTVAASVLVACGIAGTVGSHADELKEVTMAMSAFQDVNSVYVGIKEGIFRKHGIKLNIKRTDWSGANELLIGGHVNVATSSDGDAILQNGSGSDTTLAFPFFFFCGGGMMFDPKKHDWKTVGQIEKGGASDLKAAIKLALNQAKGAKIGVATSDESSLIQMVNIAGLTEKDFQIINMNQEDIPPALFSGSIDIGMGGIPQRLAAIHQGYATLMDQSALPSTCVHAGFGASRAWVDKNFDLAVNFEAAMLETIAYVNAHPDESFPIISAALKEEGTTEAVDDLKLVWNSMEFFADGKPWFGENVVSPNGRFYWKTRFDGVVKAQTDLGHLKNFNVPLESLYYGLKIVDAMK
jgi:ABC-type nitrate/sulfonate/bicarbonate transport system substrate-binding protein